MKLAEWFKARKERRRAKRELKRGLITELTELQQLDPQTEGIEEPETRYTDEYREFLRERGAEKPGAQNTIEKM